MGNLLKNPRFSKGTRELLKSGTGLRFRPEVAGSNPAPATNVMSQDIGDTRTHGNVGSGVCHFGVLGW
jgi:hypothetical protein